MPYNENNALSNYEPCEMSSDCEDKAMPENENSEVSSGSEEAISDKENSEVEADIWDVIRQWCIENDIDALDGFKYSILPSHRQ